MTGRELIIYILQNGLEDEQVIKDGKFIGFISIYEAAAKMNVGIETIKVWIRQGRLEYCLDLNGEYLIKEDCKLKTV